MAEHKPAFIVLIVLTMVVYLLTIAINAMAGSDVGREIGLFISSTGNISDKYYLEITPAGWTFSIWGFIYTWNMLWLIYALTTICRMGKLDYIYKRPQVMTPLFYFIFILNLGLNIGWLIVFDREYIIVAFVFLAFVAITLYVCIFISHVNLKKHLQELGQHSMREVWAIRILVHNGLAFYATWCTIASLLNLAMTLAYSAGLAQQHASTIALSVLSGEIIVWFILECFVFEQYFRYTVSPYIVVIVALSGSLAKNWDNEKINSIFTVVLLALAGTLAIVRLALLIWRHSKNPALPKEKLPLKTSDEKDPVKSQA